MKNRSLGWIKQRIWYVRYTYSWEGYQDFYRGWRDGGTRTGMSALFLTRESAAKQQRQWEKGEGPSTGVVHTSTTYSIESRWLWVRGTGGSARYCTKAPVVCPKPCKHCQAAMIVGKTLPQVAKSMRGEDY